MTDNNKRPLAEVLSWKAGIISAIVAILSLIITIISSLSPDAKNYSSNNEAMAVIPMTQESFWEAIMRNDINNMDKLEKTE